MRAENYSTGYQAFGSPLSGRTFTSDNYKFGFNGQRKDDEISGSGNINTAMFWEYDTRLGRRWNLDPKGMTAMSCYSAFADAPIWFSDLNGDIWDVATDEQTKKDVKSLAKEKNKKYIKIDDKGSVSLDFGKKSKKAVDRLLKRDEGLQLINDLVNAKDKAGNDLHFFYSTGGPFGFKGWKEGGEAPQDFPAHTVGENAINEADPRLSKQFAYNASVTEYGVDLSGMPQKTLLPKEGYQGQVAIAPGDPTTYLGLEKITTWEGNVQTKITQPKLIVSRVEVIKHELRENLLRTQGMKYVPAHEATQKLYFPGWNSADIAIVKFIFTK